LLAWLWIACGVPSDFCQREADWRRGCGESVEESEIKECQKALKGCSDADLGVLDAYAACLEGEPDTCTSEGFFACTAGLAELEDPTCGTTSD
jgi:hypothetical protein